MMVKKFFQLDQKENKQVNIDNQILYSKYDDDEKQKQNLKNQLIKKKQLIKILERKCGKNILLSNKTLINKINKLEQVNKKLLCVINQISQCSSNQKINIPKNEDKDQKQSKKFAISQTFEFQDLRQNLKIKQLQLEQSQKINKQLRKSLLNKQRQIQKIKNTNICDSGQIKINLRKNRFLSGLDQNSTDTNIIHKKDKPSPRFFKSLQTFKKSSCAVKVQKQKHQYKDQNIQTLKTKSNQIGIQTQQVDENSLKKQLQFANNHIKNLKHQLQFFGKKLQKLYQQKSLKDSTDNKQLSQIEMDYTQILQAFGINYLRKDRQKILMGEILGLKTNMIKLIGQIKNMEKDLGRMYRDNYALQTIVNSQKNQILNLQDLNMKNTQLINQVSQKLMKQKSKVLSFQLLNKLNIISNDD